MHELLYYSIFAIILYLVLTQVFENFNIEQENFDPSLVPVSSIVTLAKVAQKLVNGNGTLTNPGNLQIGASASTPGNLTVTGIISSSVDKWHTSTDGKNRTHYGNNSRSYYGSGDGSHEFRTGVDAGFPAMILNSGANLSLYGSITTGGGVDGITNNAGNGHLNVKGGTIITGFNGVTPMPEVNGDAGLTVQKGLHAGNITIGKFNNDPSYDVIRSGAPAGLLLSAANKNIYVWGQNILNCQNNVNVSGVLKVDGGINIPGFNGTVPMPEVNGDANVQGQRGLTVGNITLGKYNNDPSHDVIRSGAPNGLLLSAANKNIHIWGQNKLHCHNELNVGGTTTLNGAVNINNSITTTGNTTTNGYLYAGGGTAGAQVRVGELWGFPGIYTPDPNKPFRIYAENKEVMIGHPGYFNKLILYGHISYHGMTPAGLPVGTFKIRAHGWQIPLYYGWNMTWHDHGWSERMRTVVKWNDSTDDRYVHYAAIDMRSGGDGDNNWLARFYSLMPGYKLQFYCAWNAVGPEYTGEQTFGDNAFEGKRIHMIAVRLISETWKLPNPIWY